MVSKITIWLFENLFCLQCEFFQQINNSGIDTENTDHGPGMGFYGSLLNQSEWSI
jgi:hypothetical protein